jgi:acetylornithine deacetylase/succinyl-diaminopimelate desuccinylase-like protein
MKMALLNSSKEEYFDFLRFATVSADPSRAQTMKDCAGWLAGKFKGMGMRSEIVPTAGAPVVFCFWMKIG